MDMAGSGLSTRLRCIAYLFLSVWGDWNRIYKKVIAKTTIFLSKQLKNNFAINNSSSYKYFWECLARKKNSLTEMKVCCMSTRFCYQSF